MLLRLRPLRLSFTILENYNYLYTTVDIIVSSSLVVVACRLRSLAKSVAQKTGAVTANVYGNTTIIAYNNNTYMYL